MKKIKTTLPAFFMILTAASLALNALSYAGENSASAGKKAAAKRSGKKINKNKEPENKTVSEYKFDRIDNIESYKFDEEIKPITGKEAGAGKKANSGKAATKTPVGKKRSSKDAGVSSSTSSGYKFSKIDEVESYKFDKKINPITSADKSKKKGTAKSSAAGQSRTPAAKLKTLPSIGAGQSGQGQGPGQDQIQQILKGAGQGNIPGMPGGAGK